MDSFFTLAAQRRSIRKFTGQPIPEEDIASIIQAAVTAPSGCNSQCWEFVAVADRAVIGAMAGAVCEGVRALYGEPPDEDCERYLQKREKAATFFTGAPVVIAVFMTRLDYYDAATVEVYREKGIGYREMMDLLAYPDVLSVGAAVQNMLLAVEEKGYGACWMNDPAVAGERMNRVLGVSEAHRFISLIPVGVPAYRPRNKPMKKIEEIYCYIG